MGKVIHVDFKARKRREIESESKSHGNAMRASTRLIHIWNAVDRKERVLFVERLNNLINANYGSSEQRAIFLVMCEFLESITMPMLPSMYDGCSRQATLLESVPKED